MFFPGLIGVVFFQQAVDKGLCPQQDRNDHGCVDGCHEKVHKILTG